MTKWILVGVVVCSTSCGDLLNAIGMRRYGEVEDFAPSSFFRMVKSVFRNPWVMGGIASMAVAFFGLIALLSVAEVSFAVPATAASFVLDAIFAEFILKEHVGVQRWLGVAVVALGVGLLALP